MKVLSCNLPGNWYAVLVIRRVYSDAPLSSPLARCEGSRSQHTLKQSINDPRWRCLSYTCVLFLDATVRGGSVASRWLITCPAVPPFIHIHPGPSRTLLHYTLYATLWYLTRRYYRLDISAQCLVLSQ